MNWRAYGLLLWCLPWLVMAVEPGKDPVPSVMWAFITSNCWGRAVRVRRSGAAAGAPFAEDARQVPLEIDARAFTGDVVRVLAWAELNPLPKIVDFQPGSECCPGCRSAFASNKPRRCAPPCRPAMACGTSARP